MTVQCEDCGRIRADGRWAYYDMAAQALGLCPTCLHLRQETARLQLLSDERRTRRRLAHKEPFPEGLVPADPFQGFRDEPKT